MKRIVAIYARVSTEHEAQLSALENQVQYYDEILSKHPDWVLYDKYIDEGITGTSTKKRPNFLRMMEDAKDGKFDLIITREVSRFARNTVDTLQETRKLKKMGVEVYFTEDNIWTFNDDDGELKLTLMATLAQNESKKTSTRVKAGMQIAFQNGIIMGTGNILGYLKINKNKIVVDEDQAETVKFIFKEYINGKGTTAIARELSRKQIPTSTGLGTWSPSYITRVLRNPFYCGTIIYRKQYVPDYLEQRRVKNNGNVEQVIVEGNYEPIISKEDFEKAQKILDSHSKAIKIGLRHAQGVPRSMWSKKLICECGSTFNRRTYHVNKKGTTYSYECYKRKNSLEKECNVKGVQEWKLDYMAKHIFTCLAENKENREELTKVLMEGVKIEENEEKIINNEIKRYKKLIDEESEKLDRLLNMYLEETINMSTFEEFHKKHESKIETYKVEIDELEKKLKRLEPIEVKKEMAMKSIKKILDIGYNGVDERLIEEVVEKVIVHEKYFEWKLNFSDETFKIKITGKGQKDCFIEEYND